MSDVVSSFYYLLVLHFCMRRPVVPYGWSRDAERNSQSMFMSIDGQQISCAPRDDHLRMRAVPLPGAASYHHRFHPLVAFRHDSDVMTNKTDRSLKPWTPITSVTAESATF
jgi:hypothetical protein